MEPQPAVRVIVWNDIFVVIDDGTAAASDYDTVNTQVLEASHRYPAGLGCLVIIPSHARPPSQAVRDALNQALGSVPLRCICWHVEGSGFQSAMVRAVINGLRFFTQRKYPSQVARTLEDALSWILPHLANGRARLAEVSRAAHYIRDQRGGQRIAGSP